MKSKFVACAGALFALTSFPSHAVDNGIYLGASIGQSGVEIDEVIEGVDINYDADSTGYKVIAGWRFLDWLSVEGNYVDLGSGDDNVEGQRIETEVDGIS